MSFPQNNNGLPDGSAPINGGGTGTEAPDKIGLPDGSTPINGGGMDGQFPPAAAMQGLSAGQNTASESARTLSGKLV